MTATETISGRNRAHLKREEKAVLLEAMARHVCKLAEKSLNNQGEGITDHEQIIGMSVDCNYKQMEDALNEEGLRLNNFQLRITWRDFYELGHTIIAKTGKGGSVIAFQITERTLICARLKEFDDYPGLPENGFRNTLSPTNPLTTLRVNGTNLQNGSAKNNPINNGDGQNSHLNVLKNGHQDDYRELVSLSHTTNLLNDQKVADIAHGVQQKFLQDTIRPMFEDVIAAMDRKLSTVASDVRDQVLGEQKQADLITLAMSISQLFMDAGSVIEYREQIKQLNDDLNGKNVELARKESKLADLREQLRKVYSGEQKSFPISDSVRTKIIHAKETLGIQLGLIQLGSKHYNSTFRGEMERHQLHTERIHQDVKALEDVLNLPGAKRF